MSFGLSLTAFARIILVHTAIPIYAHLPLTRWRQRRSDSTLTTPPDSQPCPHGPITIQVDGQCPSWVGATSCGRNHAGGDTSQTWISHGGFSGYAVLSQRWNELRPRFPDFFYEHRQDTLWSLIPEPGYHNEALDIRDRWHFESDRNAPKTFLTAMQWLEHHYKEDFFLYVDTWIPTSPGTPHHITQRYTCLSTMANSCSHSTATA